MRRLSRAGLGIALLLHGLGHAVLPLRGAGAGPDAVMNTLAILLYSTALPGFVAAGLGVLGARAFRGWAVKAAASAAFASLILLCLMPQRDLWPGVVLNVALVLAVLALNPSAVAPRSRLRAAGNALAVAFFAYVAVATVSFPWHRRWGVDDAERVASLPGDRAPRLPALELMHAVSIDAPPEDVWPWLVQIGQDRAGFYSYDWLERLFLADIRNVDRIRPEWQHRTAGDFVRATQPNYIGGLLGEDLGWYVTEVEPNRALVLYHWGAFVLRPDGTGRTRLVVRSTVSDPSIPVWGAAISFAAFELPHFIMERRMLLGIKQRAERRFS